MVTVFHALAVILTSFRLWFRYHIRRLWWDDFWAALALICDAVCMVVGWLLTAPLDNPYVIHVISYWLNLLFYTCSIWFARLSIVFSVVRIVPPSRSVRLAAFGTGALFVLMWGFILSAKAVACSMDESWYNALVVQCPIPEWVAISEICTDVVSDVMLVALPLCLLRRVKLPSNQKIMILSVSSTSILVSVVSAVHTSYMFPRASFIGGATAEAEGALSLIVCNLLVIVTFIYRVTRGGRDITEDLSAKITGSSNRLTTVDLDFSGTLGSLSTTASGTGSGFTGTGTTGTGYSSLIVSSTSDKETSFGSIITTGGSVAVAADPVKQ
ncbi:hypothetical protein BS17DRAFT_867892 [Gyrodon lividus]|nr:hypothetical protein BS17DRAFT_867892 [Gyrodon lividus]